MDTIRVHSKGFKVLFYLYHGSAAVGFALIASFLLQIIEFDIIFIIGILMVSIPFLLAPPELIFLIEDQKMIGCYFIDWCKSVFHKTAMRL